MNGPDAHSEILRSFFHGEQARWSIARWHGCSQHGVSVFGDFCRACRGACGTPCWYGSRNVITTDEAQTQAPIVRGEFVATPSDEVTDAAFRSSVAEAVKEQGIDLAVANDEGKRLFAGKDGEAALLAIEERTLLGLTPEAERTAHVQFGARLSDLSSIRKNASGDAGDAPSGDFAIALDAALAEKGIRREHLAVMEDHLFNGRPEAYAHIVKYLDSMPPGAKLKAYVRTAEALMRLQGLFQAQG
jgi:hypothetical protein